MEKQKRISIVVNLRVEGLHCWPDCGIDEVMYLKHLHRHTFHIKCIKEVTHSNRDVEIIRFKHLIEKHLNQIYFSKLFYCLNFKGKSCEMIADELLEHFDLSLCEVLEDGENGAICIKHKKVIKK